METIGGDAGQWIRERIAGGMRLIWIAEGFDNPGFRQFLRGMRDTPVMEQTIFHDRNHITAVQPDAAHGIDIPLAIKRFNLSRLYDQVRFHVLHSKAQRALRIALVLQRMGINTPRPIAVVDERSHWHGLLRSTLITEFLPDALSMFGFTDAHPVWPIMRPYLPRIAGDIRRLHDAGIVHRDFHGGNILVTKANGVYTFSYIDLNRARIHPRLTVQQRMNDLARFTLNEEDQVTFLHSYWPEEAGQLLARYRRALANRERVVARRKSKLLFHSAEPMPMKEGYLYDNIE